MDLRHFLEGLKSFLTHTESTQKLLLCASDRQLGGTVRQRPNLIVVLGLAVFVVGAAAAWLVLRDNSSSSAADATTVLVADKPIAAGTTGQAAVAQGLIKVKKIDIKARPATALTDASQLA